MLQGQKKALINNKELNYNCINWSYLVTFAGANGCEQKEVAIGDNNNERGKGLKQKIDFVLKDSI